MRKDRRPPTQRVDARGRQGPPPPERLIRSIARTRAHTRGVPHPHRRSDRDGAWSRGARSARAHHPALTVRCALSAPNKVGEPIIELRGELRDADLERFVVVASDLEYLLALPRDRLLTHTEIRLGASILRRLLVDNQLGAVLRTLSAPRGVHPAVEATYIDEALSKWPAQWIRYAWAGGASASGAHHTGMILAVVPKEEWVAYGSPEKFLEANPMPFQGGTRRMAVNDWLQSSSVAIQTDQLGLVRISRSAVVKYVANRKGGVHFDPKRQLDLPGKRRRREIEAHLLDHGLLRVGHLSGPEFEIASMIHAVADSDWASALTQMAEDVVIEQLHGDPTQIKFWTGAKEADGTGWATMSFETAAGGAVEPAEEE
jgi:hypothetical protein